MSNPQCQGCQDELSDDDMQIGYTTCRLWREYWLTTTDYGLEPVEDEP